MNSTIQKLWNDYYEIVPSLVKVKSALNLKDYQAFNDHIAFRSISFESKGIEELDYNKYGIETLSGVFSKLGYKTKDRYLIPEKNLKAVHLECDNRKDMPKIFISELLLDECSFFLKRTLLKAFSLVRSTGYELLTAGRTWDVNYEVYKTIERESEYAAWLYIHGFRVNHFTLNVNQLKGYSIENVCAQLRTSGLKLNCSGGIIKGSQRKGLKQANTLADLVSVKFEDLAFPVKTRSCYIEFAERFKVNGRHYNGFLSKSANRIFESTDRVA